jgi:nitric oxide reductase large subunit
MNKYQWIMIAVAVINLALVGLFPPYDYISPARGNAPTFDGFYFVFGSQGSRVINSGFLQLEIFVIAANVAIAWLMLRTRPKVESGRKVDWQRVVLAGVALNLILVLLFPPMQNYLAVTRAVLPSFDGFYYLFGEHDKHTIVTQILYLEGVFILVNGALLYLLFGSSGPQEMSEAERADMVEELKRAAGER